MIEPDGFETDNSMRQIDFKDVKSQQSESEEENLEGFSESSITKVSGKTKKSNAEDKKMNKMLAI